MNYAPLWRRLVAYFIDGLIAFGVVLVILQSLIFPLLSGSSESFIFRGPALKSIPY
ncbi:MAG: hypothetical protein DWQ07_04710 [Chloroflexi bacterium]|nr:MAG: hypothetical protein DWQ07_04710 [Chloroflexota bacterium]MBL1194732.1 hypothetical protein [Chloroflexota bacterium]NOH12025.1 hypothetical protein [Chloroflexota bacterium]